MPKHPIPTVAPSAAAPTAATPVNRVLRVVGQTAALALLWAAADWAVRAWRLPVPAGVIGLAALLALLMSGRVAPAWVKDGANWLLTDMLLFFIPATVAAVQYGGLLRANGWQLALVLVGGTGFVMGVVAISVEQASRVERRLALARARRIRGTMARARG